MSNKLINALRFRSSKGNKGRVGLEVRPDGLAVAFSEADSLRYKFLPCNAADRVSTLNQWLSGEGIDSAKCFAVLPSGQYKNYLLEKPQVEDDELVDALSWKLGDMLDFDIEDAVVDTYAFPESALRGRPAQVNVVAARKSIVKAVVDLVNDTELTLDSIDIADLALRNIVHIANSASDDQAHALLYLRKGGGILAFVKADTLYLVRHFDFSLEALNDPSQQDGVIQTLALEIQRSFDYFESQMAQLPPKELLLFGPNPGLPLVNMLAGSISASISVLNTSEFKVSNDMNAVNCLLAIGAVIRERGA